MTCFFLGLNISALATLILEVSCPLDRRRFHFGKRLYPVNAVLIKYFS